MLYHPEVTKEDLHAIKMYETSVIKSHTNALKRQIHEAIAIKNSNKLSLAKDLLKICFLLRLRIG